MEKQSFEIRGLSCQNCVKSLQQAFSLVPEMQNTKIQLQYPQLSFESQLEFAPEDIQKVLMPLKKYEVVVHRPTLLTRLTETAVLYWPLLLLFGLSASVPAILTLSSGASLAHWMHGFMGASLVALAYFKLLDLKKFAEGFATYDPIAKHIKFYGFAYPFLELSTGVLFLSGLFITAASWAMVVFLGVTTVGVVQALREKRTLQCACIGTLFNLPLTKITIVENSLMIAMAGWALLL